MKQFIILFAFPDGDGGGVAGGRRCCRGLIARWWSLPGKMLLYFVGGIMNDDAPAGARVEFIETIP